MDQNQTKPWFIAIGASGGEGLDDIKELLAGLPARLNAVVLVVLHRPWDQLSGLQSILARKSAMPVVIASKSEKFENGTVYIGEPNDHLTLTIKSFGELIHDPDRLYRNRTVDLLFHSVAVHGGAQTVGVILAGSLDDGSRGLAAIHAAGGLTMVVTPGEFGRFGMPENAIAYDGVIDVIGKTGDIATAIVAAVRKPSSAERANVDAH